MKVLRKFSKKCFSARKFIVGFLVSCMFFNVPMSVVLAGPEGAQVVNGQVSFQQSGYNTTITASDKSIINYSSFDIGRPEIVEFIQPGSSASVLNRILSANPTNINGTLLANGRVFFVNPAGVYIGGGARVNVNQLVASGLNITNSDFINGNYNFAGGNGSVINSGDITAEKVYLIGRQVANSGSISCPAGYVVMASGERVFLGEPGSDVVVEVEALSLPESADPVEGSGVLNEGTIDAGGGKIILAAAGDIYSQAISNVGSLSVSSETGDAGQVELSADGGKVINSGTIEASGSKGGQVAMEGAQVGQFGTVHADGTDSDGGSVDLLASEVVALSSDSITTANAGTNGNGGDVTVFSPDTALFWTDAKIEARGGNESGDGGFVEVSGKEHIEVYGLVDTSAPSGSSGTFFIDPADVTIQNPDNNGDWSGGNPNTWTPSDSTSKVNADSQLASTNVIVNTNYNNGQEGDITVKQNITDDTGNSLTLQAADDIFLEGDIDLSGGAGNLTLWADWGGGDVSSNDTGAIDASGGGVITMGTGALLMSAGGDIGTSTDLIETVGLGELAAKTTTGGIYVNNSTSGNVDITTVDTTALGGTEVVGLDAGSGNISITNTGREITVSSAVSAASGNVTINGSSVNLDADLSASGTLSSNATTVNVLSNSAQIQDAINLAATDTTINVYADTYTEILTINTDGLELRSVTDNPDDVTIKGTANVDSGFFPLVAPNIEVLGDGVSVHGFTIEGPDPELGKYASGMVIGGLNVDIYNNKILVPNAGNQNDISQGIQTYHGDVNPAGTDLSGLHIHDNEFSSLGPGTAGYEAIYINPVTTDPTPGAVTIADNTFGGALFRGITTERSNVTISGNTLTTTLPAANTWQGILVRNYDTDPQQDVTISDNKVEGLAQGILIGKAGQTLQNIKVEENSVTGNTIGVQVKASADNVKINKNDISGNTTNLENLDGGTLDASGNWWGIVDEATILSGINNASTGSVEHSPWLGNTGSSTTEPFDYTPDLSSIYTSTSIQDAIDLAASGATINVIAGTYTENVNVNKQLSGLYFIGGAPSEVDGTLTLSDDVASNTGVDIYTKNDGGITLNDIEDDGTHSLLVDTAWWNTNNGQIDLDGSVEADGGITITGGIVNVGDGVGTDKVNSDGAVSITGTGTVTVNAEIDPTTVSIKSLSDASVAINNKVTADTQITVEADDNVTFAADGDLKTSSGSIIVTADADGDDNGSGGAISMADGTVIDAGTGTITLAADEDIALGRLLTTNNTPAAVSITSTSGAVTDAGDSGGADIDATGGADAQVTITAVTGIGIGANGAIETAVRKLAASTNGPAAHIDIDNDSGSATELTSFSTTGADADITFDQTGGGELTLTSVTTTDGTIDVSAASGNIIATLVTAGTDGDVLLDTTTSGNITLGSLTAADDQITINSADAIYDSAVDSLTDLTASALVLDAVTSIGGGVGDEIETDADTLDATVGGTGDIDLKEKDAINLVDVDTSNGNIRIEADGQITATDVEAIGTGDVELTTTSGNILVDDVKASGNQIKIDSDGAIEESGVDSSADLTASNLILDADTGIGGGVGNEIETEVATLDATVSGIGDIDLKEKDAIELVDVDTSNGNIRIEADGQITATDVEAGGAGAGDGNVVLKTTSGSVLVGNVTAADDTIMISSAGAIGEVLDDPEAVDLSAKELDLSAQTGITGQSPIETSATNIIASTDSGNIEIDNDNASLTEASVQVTPGAGNILFSQTGGGDLKIKTQTANGDIDIDVENANLTAGNITAGGTGNVTVEALQGGISGCTITANGGTLIMRQQDSLNFKDLAFGNQANTDLTVESNNGSFTADNTVAANAADKWQSITATAQSDISLEGSGDINTNALESTNGNIQIRSTSGGIDAAGEITANNGGLTMTAGGNVTTNIVNPTSGNIQIRSNGGDLIINNDLTSNHGGVSLISDFGKIYTPGSSIDVHPGSSVKMIDALNVKITGYSDGVNGVPLPFGPGVAAIVIKCGDDAMKFNFSVYDYLGLDTGATLTANGTYNITTDDLEGIGFILDPIDVAIYLGNPKLKIAHTINNYYPNNKSGILGAIKYPGTMDVDVRSKVAAIGDNGAMVIDGLEAVSFVGGGSLFETTPSAFNTTNSLQVVSRISQSLNEAVNPGGSPSPRLPYADNIDDIKSWYTGEYVLRGPEMSILARVLGMIQAVPLVPPMPLEPEIEGELEEPDMEAITQLLEELGIGVQPFLARAYRPSLNTDLTLLKAAEKLLRLGPILEDDNRVTALVPLIRGISETPVPVEEQMTSFVQELSRQELAGQWMNALTEYVSVLNNEIGWPANTSVARVMRKFGAKLTGPAERLFVQMYLERSFGG